MPRSPQPNLISDDHPSRRHLARRILNSAYFQWIDLAAEKGADYADQERERRLSYLWHDDDTSLKDSPSVTPTLASESLLSFLLPTISLPTHSLLPMNTKSRTQQQMAKEARHHQSFLSIKNIVLKPEEHLPNTHIQVILERIAEYYEHIKDIDNVNLLNFAGGSYFSDHNTDNLNAFSLNSATALPVVDSYSVGLSVALRILRLLVILEQDDRNRSKSPSALINDLRPLAQSQLSHSIHGLRHCFAAAPIEESEWRKLYSPAYDWDTLESTSDIQAIRSQLSSYGYRLPEAEPFECGWSWGLIGPPQPNSVASTYLREQLCYAVSEPYLYFTWTALAGIADLSDLELRPDELLEDNDLRAAIEVKELARLTNNYWSVLANQQSHQSKTDRRITDSRLVDIPWKTTDEDESEYYTLYLMGILYSQTGQGIDHKLATDVLEQLAQRGRITTRPLLIPSNDSEDIRAEATVETLHYPGKSLDLYALSIDSHKDPLQIAKWRIYDYAPLLLKVSIEIRKRTTDHDTRQRVNAIIDEVLTHLANRQGEPLENGLAEVIDDIPKDYGIWDDISQYLSSHEEDTSRKKAGQPFRASWYFTQRVVEALVLYLGNPAERLPATNTLALLNEILGELNDRGISTRELRTTARQWPAAALSEALGLVDEIFHDNRGIL